MVQSITRALDILEALAFSGEELSLTQLQSELELPPPTLHRLLKALVERGYVEQNSASRRYGPGPRIFHVAEAARRNLRFDLFRIVRPYLKLLTAESGETSNLVVAQNNKIVYVDQVPSPQRVRMFTEVGHRAPLYCTGAGKAILSHLPADQFEAYVTDARMEQLTPRTFASVDELKQEIANIASRGFAMDNEEFEIGVRCVAAPILNHAGLCIGAISVSGPSIRMAPELMETLGEQVRQACLQCSIQLGFIPSK